MLDTLFRTHACVNQKSMLDTLLEKIKSVNE